MIAEELFILFFGASVNYVYMLSRHRTGRKKDCQRRAGKERFGFRDAIFARKVDFKKIN